MTERPHSFEIERQVSTEEAVSGRVQAKPAESPQAHAPQKVLPEQTAAPAAEAPVPPPARTSPVRRIMMMAAVLGLFGGGAYFGWQYWTVGRFQVSTDDAYVKADNTTIAPRISGYLSEVLVGDNEQVKAGQVLARIDDRDFKVALDQARADVVTGIASVASIQALAEQQSTVIDSAKATIALDMANQTFAEQDSKRYTDLATSGYGSVQNAQSATSRIQAARAAVQRDTSALATAIKQVDLIKAQIDQAKAALDHARTVQNQAELNLSYTTIRSPIDGLVGNRTLRVGQYVQAGTQLMSVVPADAAYVIANYKETQLTDVHPGQPVEVEVDMFPGHAFHGHVDSLAPASGQEFALLPPDNATGNFTKVVQRIPVKITLDQQSQSDRRLRPGMSVTPTIEIKADPVQARAD